jgi:DNA-binding transcriptional LysR family regulator
MSQPAATKMLQEMEDLIGVRLFERGRHGLLATPYGEAMTRYAQGMSADLAGIRDELIAIQSGNIGKIRVGAIMAPVPQLLSDTLLHIKEHHPRLAISIQVDTSNVLVTALREERLDVVIGRIPDTWDSAGLLFEPIQNEALSIVCSPKNPVAQQHRTSLRELIHAPWVLQAHPSPMRKVIELAFVEARLALPLQIMETASMLLTSTLVHKSDMLAVMPELVAQHYVQRGTLAIVPLTLRQHLPPFGILTRKARTQRPATQAFIEELKNINLGT